MQDSIGVDKGQGLSNVIVDVDLHVIGKAGLGQYCTMLGWRISLRKRHSCSNKARFLGRVGSTMVGWRSLAAQGSSPSMALHTWPYAPVPMVASRSRRMGPKRKATEACSAILTPL